MTVLKPTAGRVLRVYRAASPEQVTEGLEWYANAHDIAVALDPADPRAAAGVLAALSPRMTWGRNVELARRAYDDGAASGTLGWACRKANAILVGADPLDVLSGPKERAFFTLIATPADPRTVCIDRHAIDVAIGQRLDERDRATWFQLNRNGLYETFADCYRRAAARLQVRPGQVQAVTWVAWRASVGLTG
jgi:hypothetical protein